MRDLLKADLQRARKDKLFLVLIILAIAFALFTPLLYKGILLLVGAKNAEEVLGGAFNAKAMYFEAYLPVNNFGLILPILAAIILCRDFNHGTIRNKIICGKSRTKVFFSMLLTCTILLCGFILMHALITLLTSVCLFDYQPTKFTAKDFGYLILSTMLMLLVYTFISALLTYFTITMKNAGSAIVMYFVAIFALMIFGGITEMGLMFYDKQSGFLYEALKFLTEGNPFASALIGGGETYNMKELFLYAIFPNVALTALFAYLGLVQFKKKDLK